MHPDHTRPLIITNPSSTRDVLGAGPEVASRIGGRLRPGLVRRRVGGGLRGGLRHVAV